MGFSSPPPPDQFTIQDQMGSESGNDGEISIGPFGGTGGKDFSYRNKHAIVKIVITYTDKYISSVMFKGYNDTHYSKTFGGGGGGGLNGIKQSEISINFPTDFLTGVRGAYLAHQIPKAITSLTFYTKHREYGPFGGSEYTGNSFSFRPNGGLITGFHGQTSQPARCLVSIGFYLKPISSVFVSIPTNQSSEPITLQPNNVMSRNLLPRNPGPWGSTDGRLFDDGVFSEIKQINVHVCDTGDAISAIQFQYAKRDGSTIWSHVHGVPCVDIMKKIEMGEDEYLVAIEGFNCPRVIRSLSFHTNKAKYGPVGCEIGEFFTSYVCSGKVVGVFGRSGAFLNAIGVHNEYF